MRAFLCLALKNLPAGDVISDGVLSAAIGLAPRTMTVPIKSLRHDQWVSPHRRVAMLGWTNEPDHPLLPPLLQCNNGGRVLGYAGYLAERGSETQVLDAPRIGDVADTLPGNFALYRADEQGFEAVTSVTRADAVYHAETRDLIIAGTRATLVHLVARAAETGEHRPSPDFDILALQSMVRHGFFTTDDTPFRGVKALPAHSSIMVRDGVARVTTRPLAVADGNVPRSMRDKRRLVSRLADSLVSSVEPLRRHADPPTLGLTGGRDSRLIAAVMHAAGVPFRARTYGFADHPDALIASRIASILGVDHTLTPPKVDDDLHTMNVEHPVSRAFRTVQVNEGMNSAYEGARGHRGYTVAPRMSGSGGETLRGGFLYNIDDVTTKGVQDKLATIFLAQQPLMTSAANSRARAEYDAWMARADVDRFNALDKIYLYYRTGRWLVGSKFEVLRDGTGYQPFLDNLVTREAIALSPEWRWSEEVVFLLLERLAPQLRDLPIEGHPWRFERERPRRWWEGRARRAREPQEAVGGTAGFNWRLKLDQGLVNAFSEEILKGPAADAVFELVDARKIEKVLATMPMTRPNQAWNLITLSVLLSRDLDLRHLPRLAPARHRYTVIPQEPDIEITTMHQRRIGN